MHDSISNIVASFAVYLVLGSLLLIRRSHKRAVRRAALSEPASVLGWRHEADTSAVLPALSGLAMFRMGHDAQVENLLVMEGTLGRAWLFDYRFRFVGGAIRPWRSITAAAFVDLPHELPEFRVHPVCGLTRVASVMGWADIDIPDYPEFSARYYLNAPREYALRRIMTDDVIQAIQALGSVSIEADGSRVTICSTIGLRDPRDLPEFANLAGILVESLTETRASQLRPKNEPGGTPTWSAPPDSNQSDSTRRSL